MQLIFYRPTPVKSISQIAPVLTKCGEEPIQTVITTALELAIHVYEYIVCKEENHLAPHQSATDRFRSVSGLISVARLTAQSPTSKVGIEIESSSV